jgi:hypothetical protein
MCMIYLDKKFHVCSTGSFLWTPNAKGNYAVLCYFTLYQLITKVAYFLKMYTINDIISLNLVVLLSLSPQPRMPTILVLMIVGNSKVRR